jgi:hypothetical protein
MIPTTPYAAAPVNTTIPVKIPARGQSIVHLLLPLLLQIARLPGRPKVPVSFDVMGLPDMFSGNASWHFVAYASSKLFATMPAVAAHHDDPQPSHHEIFSRK